LLAPQRAFLACGSMEVDVSFFRFWLQAAKNERKMTVLPPCRSLP
jgi:hypothetical protein